MIFLITTKFSDAQKCNPRWDRTKSLNCAFSPIQFEANSPGKTAYSWEFGPGFPTGIGRTLAFRDPVHAFAKAGTYIIKYKFFGLGSDTCSDTIMITIRESPTIFFRALSSLSQPFADNKFCFLDSSKSVTNHNVNSLKYSFSDGSEFLINNPKGDDTVCHSFTSSKGGIFDLFIEADDTNGCTVTNYYFKMMKVLPMIESNLFSGGTSRINIYPNPTKDYLNVNLLKPSVIKVFSIFGELLINETHTQGMVNLNLETLSPAEYLIEVFDGNFYYRQLIYKR